MQPDSPEDMFDLYASIRPPYASLVVSWADGGVVHAACFFSAGPEVSVKAMQWNGTPEVAVSTVEAAMDWSEWEMAQHAPGA